MTAKGTNDINPVFRQDALTRKTDKNILTDNRNVMTAKGTNDIIKQY